MKFTKKPFTIEAFQMTRERRADNSEWPEWLNRAWQEEREAPGSLYPTKEGTPNGTLSIGTLEGQYLVSWDDWIIQGVKGELYPCKPDIFEATYEPASVASGGAQAIAAERKRQIEKEGWTPEHDDEHGFGQLSQAATAYLLTNFGIEVLDRSVIPSLGMMVWPWDPVWWKPKGTRSNLVKAGALIAAEIDRLDRVDAILGPESQDNEQETK